MSNARIAHRYAKPLLELAEEQKALESVRNDMLSISTLCQENREFSLMLRSPIISHYKKAEILNAIFGKRSHSLTLRFIEILTRKNREQVLSDIATEFLSLYNAKMGLQDATVVTSASLDAADRKAIEKLVQDITGKKTVLKEKVDSELIGGYVLKLGDRQIDDSVSGKLRELKSRFHKENR